MEFYGVISKKKLKPEVERRRRLKLVGRVHRDQDYVGYDKNYLYKKVKSTGQWTKEVAKKRLKK